MHAAPVSPVEVDCAAEKVEDAIAEEAAAEKAEESVVLTMLLSIKSGSKDAG